MKMSGEDSEFDGKVENNSSSVFGDGFGNGTSQQNFMQEISDKTVLQHDSGDGHIIMNE